MKMLVLICVMVVVAAAVGIGSAQTQELRVGDVAPPFNLPGTDGKTHNLSDYKGTPVVLAWFPKAFTGG